MDDNQIPKTSTHLIYAVTVQIKIMRLRTKIQRIQKFKCTKSQKKLPIYPSPNFCQNSPVHFSSVQDKSSIAPSPFNRQWILGENRLLCGQGGMDLEEINFNCGENGCSAIYNYNQSLITHQYKYILTVFFLTVNYLFFMY